MDDKELYQAAMADEPVTDVATETTVETPAAETVETGQPRDEHGRFAKVEGESQTPAADTPTDAPQAPQGQPPAPTEANVPSWRLREVNEAREAAERRANEAYALLRQMQAAQPRPEQPPVDPFENPEAFRDFGVKQAVEPIRSEIDQTREFWSRRFAEQQHGADKIKAAYDALDQAARSGDQEAMQTVQRVKRSMDPFGDMVAWHAQRTVYSQIGNDPNAWFEKRQQELLKDPAYQAKLMQQIQQSTSGQPQRQNLVQLPPSLNRVAAAQGASDDDTDMSSEGLFRHAMR